MFDMDSLVQPHLDRIRPLAQSAAAEARGWGLDILARLDRIADAVDQDVTRFWRERPQFNLTAGTSDTFIVPAGEQWVLEAVTMVPTGAVGTPGGVTLSVGGGLPLFGANHPGRPRTEPGNDIRLESGMQVTITALEVGCTVMAQVRVERKVAKVAGRYTATNPGTDGDDATPNPDPGRHVGTWMQHRV